MEMAETLYNADPFIRHSSARQAAFIAIATNDRGWLIMARNRVAMALVVDSSYIDFIQKLLVLDIKLGDMEDAEKVFEVFKRYSPKSQLVKILEDARGNK